MIGTNVSSTFLKNVPSILRGEVYILPRSMEPVTFAEYVRRNVKAVGGASEAERRGKAEATARGLEDSHKCSDSTIIAITNEEAGNVGRYTLQTLAWGIGRPIEEVVAYAFQLQDRNGDMSGDLLMIGELHEKLPPEDKRYFSRQIEKLKAEVLDARNAQLKKKKGKSD